MGLALGSMEWALHHRMVPRWRLEIGIEIQDGARLVSWIVGMCGRCWLA